MENKKIAFLNSGIKLFHNSKQGISLFLCSNIFYFIGIAYGFLLKNHITTLDIITKESKRALITAADNGGLWGYPVFKKDIIGKVVKIYKHE